MHILGVMSGSSLDALDLALVRFELSDKTISDWQLLFSHAEPLLPEWKLRLTQLPDADLRTFFETDAAFGKWIGVICRNIIEHTGIIPDAIASHGHTILHHPEKGYSVQIGNAAHIAWESGCDVITNLRSHDIAAGGQGAPLAPVAEYYLFPGYDYYLNLGGIANLTCVKEGLMRAWDIAAANQLLNFLAEQEGRPFDKDGESSRRGKVNRTLVDLLRRSVQLPLSNPYSMDNSWVRQEYFPRLVAAEGSVADKLASVTEYIAQSVRAQIEGCGMSGEGVRLLVTGGGVHNTYLIERIKHHVEPAELVVPSSEIIDYKEAILMAVCGVLRLIGKPNAFASVTGAAYNTINGNIFSGRLSDRSHEVS